MGKKMIINCSCCDTRQVSEETLKKYEAIVINAGIVLTNERSRTLLDGAPVTMNCANVLDIEGDVKVCTVNGSGQIKSTDSFDEKRYYVVNGTMTIGAGTEKVLENVVGMTINGSVLYPESLSGKVPMSVNGSTLCYPDGAIVLKRSALIDRTFALRAKEALYWSAKRMIMVDEKLDSKALAAKGVRFETKQAILTESKAEDLVPLIDENADLVIVPDGTAVIADHTVLDDILVKKHGAKLYVIGNLEVNKDAAQALEKIEYLNIRGDLRVCSELKDRVLEKADEIGGNVKVMKGRYIEDKMSFRVTRWMLEQEPDGVAISDCMNLRLDEDIDSALILERLTISDCLNVKCTPEQEAAVSMIARDVMNVGSGSGEGGDETGIGSMIKDALGGGALGNKVINAADYVM